MQRSRRRIIRLPAALVTLMMAASFGCMTLEQMAPPVDPFLVGVAAESGYAADAVERGRVVYLDKCVRCHNVEPIGRYTIGKWETILPEMNKESKLTPAAANDLRQYILAARRTLDRPRPVPSAVHGSAPPEASVAPAR